MLRERPMRRSVEPRPICASYARFGDLAEAVQQHEPTEYWKAGPYLVNFMEQYKLKQALDAAALAGCLPRESGWCRARPAELANVEAYAPVDPQNGRLRWLLDDLDRHRAFELLWIPPSLRYYDTGSVYESDEARASPSD